MSLCVWLYHCYVVGEVSGVTRLGDVIYVVRRKSSVIRRYSADTLSPLDDDIHVEGMEHPTRDIAACRHDRQLYIAEHNEHCIWRVSTNDHSSVKWLSIEDDDTFKCWALSLTSRRLLVTSAAPPVLRQYNTVDRQLLRDIELPRDVRQLLHAVETRRETYVVGYQGTPHHKYQWAVSDLFSSSRRQPR